MMKYSVVIITANRQNFLKNCIDKLFEYEINKKAEIIVVDASDIEFEFDKKNEIKYIKIEPKDKGFSNQRNIGIKSASNDYVIFIDDDVEITQNWFDNLVGEFEKYKDEVFGLMGAVFPKQNKILSFVCGVLGHPGGGFRLHNFSKNKVIYLSQVSTCNTVFNKKLIEEVGMFDVNNKFGSEDSELCLRITRKYGNNKFVYTPYAIVWHYSPNTISKFIKWYIRRGISDMDIYLSHSVHLSYIIKTSVILKILPVLVLAVFNVRILYISFIIYYLWQLFKHKFMFKYFSYYKFGFLDKLLTFFIFPILKLLADLMFDFGRIKRIIDVKLK